MNRIDRLTAILIHLQSKSIVTADELSRRFEISIRTVYRDIRALEEAGVPIGAEAGKGYFITEGYHLPPVRFSREEASALLIAHKLVDEIADKSIKDQYDSAMFKIKSVLGTGDKEFLETVNSQVQIFYSKQDRKDTQSDKVVTTILKSLSEKRMIKIDYHSYSKDETTCDRLIEPIGLCYYSVSWHLIAYCRLRDGYRDFRTDRIKKIELTDRYFEQKSRPTLNEYFKSLAGNDDLFPVILQFDKEVAKNLNQAKYYYGYMGEKEVDDKVEIKFLVNSLNYIARWIITFVEGVDVVEPADLKEILKDFVKNLQKNTSRNFLLT